MHTLENSKFESIINEMFDRYTQGAGFLKGDVIRVKKEASNSDWFKSQASTVQARLKDMMGESNRIYRISCLKSEKPRSAGSFGIDNPICSVADVVREINPSFWMDPITIPLQYLESIDPGVNMPPYDKDLVRKDTSHVEPTDKIENQDEVGAKQTLVDDDQRKITDKNTKLPYGNKWDDKKPGAGNTVRGFLRKNKKI